MRNPTAYHLRQSVRPQSAQLSGGSSKSGDPARPMLSGRRYGLQFHAYRPVRSRQTGEGGNSSDRCGRQAADQPSEGDHFVSTAERHGRVVRHKSDQGGHVLCDARLSRRHGSGEAPGRRQYDRSGLCAAGFHHSSKRVSCYSSKYLFYLFKRTYFLQLK